MNERKLIEQWISAFGEGIDQKIIDDHVISFGNHLWHLFTWGNVSYLEGSEARIAFDDLQYIEAIRFYDGYSNNIEDVSEVGKLSSVELDNDSGSDVYVVAKDFTWTYVRTHEKDWCGPYLCIKK